MDSRISPSSSPEMVLVESKVRPTPTPVRVPFSQVLAAGVSNVAAGAQTALSKLPGSPIQAAAVRGASAPALGAGTSLPEGPASVGVGTGLAATPVVGLGGTGAPLGLLGGTSAAGTASAGTDPNSIGQAMQQMADENLYYLQVQQQVDAQNRVFTTLSNVLKTEHDSDKAAINNIHS